MERGSLALVTGASSGIGRATALRFARAGFRVVAVARSTDKLEALADEVRRDGRAKGSVIVETVDVSDGRAVLEMAGRVLDAHGAPRVVVNNAGAGRWLDVEETTPEELHQMMGAPFYAAFHVCHAFLEAMRAEKRGVLIHVNSPVCLQPWPGATGYACSRWALRGLHESLRVDLHKSGLHSCHVIFGEVTSEYFDANPGSHQRMPKIAKLIPKMSPQDCADVLYEVAHKPRAEVIEPFMLRTLVASQSLSPAITRALTARTGRKRD
jgi:short-subunit dehydrogenase